MITINKLSESNLKTILLELYPGQQVYGQKRIKIDKKQLIIDYVVDNTYIEFDGPTHYTDSKTQIRDVLLEMYCIEQGFNLIRIPYFLQLNSSTIKELFNIENSSINSEYSSGFVDGKNYIPR